MDCSESQDTEHIGLDVWINYALKENLMIWLIVSSTSITREVYFPQRKLTTRRIPQLCKDSVGSYRLECECFVRGKWMYFQDKDI